MKNYKIFTIIILIFLLLPVIFISGCSQGANVNLSSNSLNESAITTNPQGKDFNLEYSDESTTSTNEDLSDSTTSTVANTTISTTTNTTNTTDSSSTSTTKSKAQKDESSGSKEYANNFTLLDYNNKKVSLSDFKGKLVVVNFFGTWCAPCKEEIPDFVAAYSLFKDKNIQFIGISEGSDVQTVKDFVNEYKINYPILIDGTPENMAANWGITGIPTTFLFNTNGELIGAHVGPLTKDQLVSALEGVK